MESRCETLLDALINGGTVNVEPLSRIEAILQRCIDRTGTDGLPEPLSRNEAYFMALANALANGSFSSANEVVLVLSDYSEAANVVANVEGTDYTVGNASISSDGDIYSIEVT